jgi:hypothetical protein
LAHFGFGVGQDVGIEPVTHHRLHTAIWYGHGNDAPIERVGYGLDVGLDHWLEGEGECLGQQVSRDSAATGFVTR